MVAWETARGFARSATLTLPLRERSSRMALSRSDWRIGPRYMKDHARTRADSNAKLHWRPPTMPHHDLVVLGDCNPDLLLAGDVVPRFGQAEQLLDVAQFEIGGSGAIVAAGAARLGLRTALIALVGDDALGHIQLAA